MLKRRDIGTKSLCVADVASSNHPSVVKQLKDDWMMETSSIYQEQVQELAVKY